MWWNYSFSLAKLYFSSAPKKNCVQKCNEQEKRGVEQQAILCLIAQAQTPSGLFPRAKMNEEEKRWRGRLLLL